MAAVAVELGAAVAAAAAHNPPSAAAVAAVVAAVEGWMAVLVGTPLLGARLSGSPPYPSEPPPAMQHLCPDDQTLVDLLDGLVGHDGTPLLHVRLATVERTLEKGVP